MNQEDIENAAGKESEHPFIEIERKGFIRGAEWRINSVWHDASEDPQHSGMLIAINKDGTPIVCGPNNSNWNITVKIFHVERWAYIKDLIPNMED